MGIQRTLNPIAEVNGLAQPIKGGGKQFPALSPCAGIRARAIGVSQRVEIEYARRLEVANHPDRGFNAEIYDGCEVAMSDKLAYLCVLRSSRKLPFTLLPLHNSVYIVREPHCRDTM